MLARSQKIGPVLSFASLALRGSASAIHTKCFHDKKYFRDHWLTGVSGRERCHFRCQAPRSPSPSLQAGGSAGQAGCGGPGQGFCRGGDVGGGDPAAQRQAHSFQCAAVAQAHGCQHRGRGVGAAVAGRASGCRDPRCSGQQVVPGGAVDADVEGVGPLMVGRLAKTRVRRYRHPGPDPRRHDDRVVELAIRPGRHCLTLALRVTFG